MMKELTREQFANLEEDSQMVELFLLMVGERSLLKGGQEEQEEQKEQEEQEEQEGKGERGEKRQQELCTNWTKVGNQKPLSDMIKNNFEPFTSLEPSSSPKEKVNGNKENEENGERIKTKNRHKVRQS